MVEITRADSQMIDADVRHHLLGEFGISADALLAKGTEAEVYFYADDAVLKLYATSARQEALLTLQRFYEGIDESGCGFLLPRIQRVSAIRLGGGGVAVLERRIEGIPLESVLPNLSGVELQRAEDLYFSAAASLSKIKLTIPPTNYLLFDSSSDSALTEQSWPSFYSSLLLSKLTKVKSELGRVSAELPGTIVALAEVIRAEVSVPLATIHGDFFPGNVMVKPDLSAVTGVIDFGSFTMFGDPLVDMASAFGFYEMYDPDRAALRARLLPRVLSHIPSDSRANFFRYLLGHAVLTSDLYVTERDVLDNGHFQWAAEILCRQEYWKEALA